MRRHSARDGQKGRERPDITLGTATEYPCPLTKLWRPRTVILIYKEGSASRHEMLIHKSWKLTLPVGGVFWFAPLMFVLLGCLFASHEVLASGVPVAFLASFSSWYSRHRTLRFLVSESLDSSPFGNCHSSTFSRENIDMIS